MTHGKIIIIIFHNELNKFKSGLTLLALRQLSINRYEDKSFIIGFYARSSGRKQKMKNKDELKREPSFCYCLAQKPFEEVGSERPFFCVFYVPLRWSVVHQNFLVTSARLWIL